MRRIISSRFMLSASGFPGTISAVNGPSVSTRNKLARPHGSVANSTTRQTGFTLLEVLAAVAILGLLLVLLTQGVHFGLLATQSEARIGSENAGLQEIDQALRHLIEATDPGSEAQPSLLGRRNTLTMLTELPGDKVSSDPVEAVLFVDRQHRPVLHLGAAGRQQSGDRRGGGDQSAHDEGRPNLAGQQLLAIRPRAWTEQ